MPQRKAFVLMPFREPFNSYYPRIFKRALETAGFTVTRADNNSTPLPIISDIQRSIRNADLILCEMSDRNPNVFYELGMSHAIGKPVVLVVRKEESIPFDVSHIRVIIYDSTVAGWENALRRAVKAAANAALASDEIWPPALIPSETSPKFLDHLSSERASYLNKK